MTLWPLYLICIAVSIVLLAVTYRLLIRRGWLGGFARGLVGFGSLAFVVVTGFILFDLAAYRALTQESVVATLSFHQLAPQRYEVDLSVPGRVDSRTYELQGDQWQVDARVLTWQGPLSMLGMEPLYRLERLAGRYQDLRQERGEFRSVYALEEEGLLGINRLTPQLPWVDARFGSAAYMPMVDGGVFEVRLTARGLIARPVNSPARDAVEGWFSE